MILISNFKKCKKSDLFRLMKKNGLDVKSICSVTTLSRQQVQRNFIVCDDVCSLSFGVLFLLASQSVLSDEQLCKVINEMKSFGCDFKSASLL